MIFSPLFLSVSFTLPLLIIIVQKLVRKLVCKPACMAVFSVSRQRKYDMIHDGVSFGAVPERPRWPLTLPRRRQAREHGVSKGTTLPECPGLKRRRGEGGGAKYSSRSCYYGVRSHPEIRSPYRGDVDMFYASIYVDLAIRLPRYDNTNWR